MNLKTPPTLAVVVPCFNEALSINEAAKKLEHVFTRMLNDSKIDRQSFIYWVDDGSEDETWELIENLYKKNPAVFKGLKLLKNYGHQNALLAGLLAVKDRVDCVISIDADLQQDENAIPQFLKQFEDGADIVCGVRISRDTDHLLKKITALGFYWIMQKMGVELIKNHADYRLVSARVLKVLSEYREVNLFLRGIFIEMGFKIVTIPFDVRERYSGESKYTFKKMLLFALNGITSFSVMPLRVIAVTGFLTFLTAISMSLYAIYVSLTNEYAVPGWASTVLPIYILGGIQLFSIGIVGEYVGKNYIEIKSRPRYVCDCELK